MEIQLPIFYMTARFSDYIARAPYFYSCASRLEPPISIAVHLGWRPLFP